MRGKKKKQPEMLALINPEALVPQNHPIREIKKLADAALKEMSLLFDEMYDRQGRKSIPPERLLKASLLMALYTLRSERQFCEQLNYNLLYKWFLDMNLSEEAFDHSSFSQNRARLLKHRAAERFFLEVVELARKAHLLSAEHFTVDGTLIEAWASLKSFKRKDGGDDDKPDDPGNPTVDFKGEKRRNDTHESTTDPEAKLAKKGKGKEAKLCHSGHALMENRNGLLIDLRIAEANGTAERDEALAMLEERLPGSGRITVGADKGYDTRDFVEDCRALNITPHVAQNDGRPGGSAIDQRTTRQPGYSVSLLLRKRIEEIFGWLKTVGNFRKTRYKGREKTQLAAYLTGAAYNLLRIAKLLLQPA